MVGVEAGGEGIIPNKHAARFQGGSLGVLQGTRSFLLQDEYGQIQLTHSVSAGLDYAAVGPEHAWLRDQKRAEYTYATDDQALEAFMKLARLEGIIPALESAHAVAECMVRAPKLGKDALIIVNLSGRGDKDVAQVAAKVKLEMPK
jgi:tryptophan synthase beta chain